MYVSYVGYKYKPGAELDMGQFYNMIRPRSVSYSYSSSAYSFGRAYYL